MPPEKRKRIQNTRDDSENGRIKPEPKRIIYKALFSEFASEPDADGYFLRHMAPETYHCSTLTIYLDSTSGARIQLGVNNEEFVERDVVQGANVLQVNRIVPAGTRIRMRFVDGTSARGIWASWQGILNA